jgi:hypothetical protein
MTRSKRKSLGGGLPGIELEDAWLKEKSDLLREIYTLKNLIRTADKKYRHLEASYNDKNDENRLLQREIQALKDKTKIIHENAKENPPSMRFTNLNTRKSNRAANQTLNTSQRTCHLRSALREQGSSSETKLSKKVFFGSIETAEFNSGSPPMRFTRLEALTKIEAHPSECGINVSHMRENSHRNLNREMSLESVRLESSMTVVLTDRIVNDGSTSSHGLVRDEINVAVEKNTIEIEPKTKQYHSWIVMLNLMTL